MIEVYVITALVGLGYILNSGRSAATAHQTGGKKLTIDKGEIENMSIAAAQAVERKRAAQMYAAASRPNSRVVMRDGVPISRQPESGHKSLLAGVEIERFAHNNMVPFFGGRMTQNMSESLNQSTIANFTGVNPLQAQKTEVRNNVAPVRDPERVLVQDVYRDRIVDPRTRNNVFPVPQVRVGPGLNKGFAAEPSGGFQDFEIQNVAMPKTVDELRVLTNPKMTFEGRTVDGQRGSVPAEIGKVDKNRPDTWFEQRAEDMLPTSAAFRKPEMHGDYDLNNETQRATTSMHQHMGHAFEKSRAGTTTKNEAEARESHRSVLSAFGIANAWLGYGGVGEKTDYGRANIEVFDNERDLTTERTYQGNVTSLIKAIAAPLLDIAKTNRRELFVDAPRHFGQFQTTMPSKAPAKDPNDVARTTIKETTIHDTTVGPLTGPKCLGVYDPDEVARTTIRETLRVFNDDGNLESHVRRGAVYDPDNIARTTIRETTEADVVDGGITALERTRGGYESAPAEAPATQKQFISDKDYIGQAGRGDNDGYLVAPAEAHATQKQFLSDNDYYGQAGSVDAKAKMSYADAYAARVSATQELLLNERVPTVVGAKQGPMQETAPKSKPISVAKAIGTTVAERQFSNIDHVTNVPLQPDCATFTKQPLALANQGGRAVDTDILTSLATNPYAIPRPGID
jgi:hypothetical protein